MMSDVEREPEQREGIEDLSLAGDGGKDPVESGNPVRGGDQDFTAKIDYVTHLAVTQRSICGEVEALHARAKEARQLRLAHGYSSSRVLMTLESRP